jgi:glycosyltransferase involved in cell wall biosynthesis
MLMTTTIVMPFHNQRARIASRTMAILQPSDELLAVDDGSIDGGTDMLRELAARDPRLRLIVLRRPFGQTAALAAGFDRAKGDVIVTIDANGQTDPADIATLLAEIVAGADLVSGRRDIPRSLPTQIGNALIARVTHVHLHDYGCPLKAYRAEVLREMRLYGDLYRLAPAVANWHGAKISEVPVRELPGHGVRPGTGLGRVAGVLIDLFTVAFMLNYRARPMQAIGRFAGILALSAVMLGSYLAYLRLIVGQDIGERPLLIMALLAAVLAAQLLVTGLLAELATRVYYESQNKTIYVVREEIGFEEHISAS